eukprot:scaffold236254_cov22-Tisochrysis_lutea.AAC.3
MPAALHPPANKLREQKSMHNTARRRSSNFVWSLQTLTLHTPVHILLRRGGAACGPGCVRAGSRQLQLPHAAA